MFLVQFYFVFPGLKIIGLGNPDNNLESLRIFYVQSNDYKKKIHVEFVHIWKEAVNCYVVFCLSRVRKNTAH
jgi:hypothetical protein